MTFLTILIVTIMFIFLVRRLTEWTNFALPRKHTKLLLRIYAAIFGFLLITIGLSYLNIYWRGYGSTIIILLATTVSGLILYWFHPRQEIGKPLRIALLLLSIICVPVSGLLTWDCYSKKKYAVFYNDNKYRLEQTFKGFLAPASLPDLFVKEGLIEKKYELPGQYLSKNDLETITIREYKDGIATVVFHHSADTSYGLKNPMIINIKTN